MFKRNQEQLQQDLRVIKKQFGIDLKWTEIEALSFYPLTYPGENSETSTLPSEGMYRFMYEYFDLYALEIGRFRIPEFRKGGMIYTSKEYGLAFDRDPRFMEYCRRHIEQWRAERELI
ncbi:MAG: hypothetical protein KKG60_03935 [Nanoarchaeota archaeon]|nr:hypothetical protein [Nanoarchaeota archaeon]